MATAAERKAAERARKRAAGLVLVQVWVPESAVETLRRYAARLSRQHTREKPNG